jgi:hypothetical protein
MMLFLLPFTIIGAPLALILSILIPSPDSSGNESGLGYFWLMATVLGFVEAALLVGWWLW